MQDEFIYISKHIFKIENKVNSLRIKQLDGMRGIFALMVFLLHFPVVTYLTDNFFVRQSYLFVDFFFVLSGFIITSNYLEKIESFSDFKIYLLKRFIRLYPLLLYTVLIYFFYLMLGEYYLQGIKQDHRSFHAYFIELLDSLFLFNSVFILGDSQGINPPSWSISAEIISYIFFGLGALFFRKFKIIYSLLIILICISFMIHKNSYVFNNGDFGFIRGLLGFNFGVLTYILSNHILIKSSSLQFLLVLVVLFAFFIIDLIKIELLKLMFPLIFSFLILVFLYENSFVNRILINKGIQFLGKISYSFYLNHYLILFITYNIFFKILEVTQCKIYTSLVLLVSISVTVIYSYLTYLFIEKAGGGFLANIFFIKKIN